MDQEEIESTENQPELVPDVPEVDPPEHSEPHAYEPNFKYKVYDEEREFPEYVRNLIDSEEREKELREVFGKYGAFDSVKEKWQRDQDRLKDVEPRYQQMQSTVNRMYDSIKNKDLDTFFEIAGIKEDDLIPYVSKVLQMKENPEIEAAYQAKREASKKAFDLESRYVDIETKYNSILENQHKSQLQGALSDPEVSSFVSQYDEAKGDGSFRRRVQEYGEWQASMNKYVTPTEAVRYVMDQIFVGNPNQGHISQPTPSAPKPTLPKMGGGKSASPVSKGITSMSDVMKYRQQKFGR